MEKRTVPIVFATDDNYVLPLAVAIKSMLDHKSDNDEYKIYVFCDKLSEKSINILKEVCGENYLEIVRVTNHLTGTDFYEVGHVSLATYYRFFIPKILSNYDKVLYLDCDILIQNDIGKLYDVELGENILSGNRMFGIENEYVNAGILLFNVKEYLKNDVCEKCIKYIADHRDLKYPDEQALNDVCKGKIKHFDYKFNYQTFFCGEQKTLDMAGAKKIKDIYLIHYSDKPWKVSSTPLGNLWWKTAKKMPKDIRKEIYEKFGQNQNQNDFYYYKYYFASPLGRLLYKIKKKFKNK